MFVLEDGTGVVDANAYISVAFYRAYWTDRGQAPVAAPTLPDATIQGWIVRATDYVEKRFGLLYRGDRKTLTQALGMPRTGIILDGVTVSPDAVPALFQSGIAEYAKRVATLGELAPDAPVNFDRVGDDGETISGGGLITGKREKVGPIEEETKFSDPASYRTGSLPAYPAADLLIAYFLRNTAGRTIRA